MSIQSITKLSTQNKKAAILKAMLRLITEQGVHATPMSQVAKEANVAAGTIYHYFDSKEHLLNELYLELKKEFGAMIVEQVSSSGDFEEQFRSLWRILFQYFTENPMSFKFAEQISHSPLITDKIKQEGLQYYAPVYTFFEKGMRLGKIKAIDPLLLVGLVYGNIITTVHLQLTGEVNIDSIILEQAIDFSWNAIKNN
jgi:AcrR family transcriptional regulator